MHKKAMENLRKRIDDLKRTENLTNQHTLECAYYI